MTRPAWAIVLGAVAFAIALWAYFNFETVTERRFVGYSGEAARNPLLALERLAREMGVEATTVRRATDLERLDPGAILVLAAHRHGMTPERVARVIRWVEDGGRLVVEAEALDTRDALLEALQVARRAAATLHNASTEIALPGHRPMKIVIVPIALADMQGRPGFKAAHATGTALLQFAQGRGSVAVLPSFWFMTNGQIGHADHAAFAWALLNYGPKAAGRASSVVIAPRFDRPSLFAWLAGEALPALVAAAVLLALWLARAIPRFGPVLTHGEGARRRLLDHLRASGRFQWSAHQAPRLLAAAREGCLANIAKARPALANLEPSERLARYAELTGLPHADIELALAGDAATPRTFIAAVQTLQIIEQKLARRAAA